MSTFTNKIKNIFGASNNTAYTSTGANITTSNSTTGTIYTNTPGTSITNTGGWSTIVGGINNTVSSSTYLEPELSIHNAKLSHTYKNGEQFFQHEILVVRIHRDQDNRITKTENICQYWIGSPYKELIEYKNTSIEDKPEIELVIRTLRTIQL